MEGELGFQLWLKYGQVRGWVSDIVCETHDALPMRDSEQASFEEGYDPCVPALRVWGATAPLLAGVETGAQSAQGEDAAASLRRAV